MFAYGITNQTELNTEIKWDGIIYMKEIEQTE